MGCDIHAVVQQQDASGTWERIYPSFPGWEEGTTTSQPFDWRAYGMYGFLADVRNYSFVPPLSEPRGIPADFKSSEEDMQAAYGYPYCEGTWLGEHSYSWLLVSELLEFDYNTTFEDRRTMRDGNGAADAGKGNGITVTFREFLSPHYFRDLEILRNCGDPQKTRIVFGFDS